MTPQLQSGEQRLVLVTGASGFLGSAIAHAARNAGYRVRVLVRPASVRTNIHAEDDIAIGDLRHRESVAAAMRDVRYVIHTAADYRLWAASPDEIVRNNVDSTRIVMEEALNAHVERIVYTSSVPTIALQDGMLADESQPLHESKAIGAYKKSKVVAERLVDKLVRQRKLPVVIVNPSTPIGPRDVKPTPTGRVIVEAAAGRMPCFVDTGLNLAHVDDVAVGHIAPLQRCRIGEHHI